MWGQLPWTQYRGQPDMSPSTAPHPVWHRAEYTSIGEELPCYMRTYRVVSSLTCVPSAPCSIMHHMRLPWTSLPCGLYLSYTQNVHTGGWGKDTQGLEASLWRFSQEFQNSRHPKHGLRTGHALLASFHQIPHLLGSGRARGPLGLPSERGTRYLSTQSQDSPEKSLDRLPEAGLVHFHGWCVMYRQPKYSHKPWWEHRMQIGKELRRHRGRSKMPQGCGLLKGRIK